MTYVELLYKLLNFIRNTGIRIKLYYEDEDNYSIKNNKEKATKCFNYLVFSELLKDPNLSNDERKKLESASKILFVKLSCFIPDFDLILSKYAKEIDKVNNDPFNIDLLMQLEDPEISEERRQEIKDYLEEIKDNIPCTDYYFVDSYPIEAILRFALTAIPHLYFSFMGYEFIDQKYHIYDDSLRKDLFYFMIQLFHYVWIIIIMLDINMIQKQRLLMIFGVLIIIKDIMLDRIFI